MEGMKGGHWYNVAIVLLLAGVLVTTLLPRASLLLARDGYQADIQLGSFYYKDNPDDPAEPWKEINNQLVPAIVPWDWQMLEDSYKTFVLNDFTAGQVLKLESQGSTVAFQPMGLLWTNNLDQLQQISMPQNVSPVVTAGTIRWDNAYGIGRDFEWANTPGRLNKLLQLDAIPLVPVQYIIDGGDPVLKLDFIFAPSSDLDIYVDGQLWDKSSKEQTVNDIEFKKDGELLWIFSPAEYWDSDPSKTNQGVGITTLSKTGNKLYVSALVPYSWLQTAVYPVFIDPDIQVDDNTASTQFYFAASRGGPFWTSPTVGYVVFLNYFKDLVYRKTINGGATWSGRQVIVAAAACDSKSFDVWVDWQTVDDAGTKIHIVYISSDLNEIRYVYLDTSDDSVGGDDLLEASQGTGTINSTVGRDRTGASITKTRGGNLAVAFCYFDDASSRFYSFYTSPDGDTWTSETSPWENTHDYLLLFPGNEADSQDVWAVYWDKSTNTVSLKTYDDSDDSWSEQSISGGLEDANNYLQMDGVIRPSDGHLILAVWSEFDAPTADLKIWDINGAGSITAKTNVLTDLAESFLVSVFIDPNTDDIYIAYAKGGTILSNLIIYYQKSSDGGANWDGETIMQANTGDDMRWLSGGVVKAAWGGKFQPVWLNQDFRDLFTNSDNGISIVAGPPPAPPPAKGTLMSSAIIAGEASTLELLIASIVLISLSVITFWKPAAPLLMLLAGLSLMMGLGGFNSFSSEAEMAIGLALVGYSFICIGYTFRLIFRRGDE